MCAIAGIFDPKSNDPTHAKTMLDLMQARGPNAQFLQHFGNFIAGANRLSINDPSPIKQPFCDDKKEIFVFFNGEIYNFATLKEELRQDGIIFKTCCDGEILGHLYAKYGKEMFARLDGMFALCIFDGRKIILARDMLGEKPLYYYHQDKIFAFASLVMPLAKIFEVSLNPQAMWDFLTFGFIPEEQSIFEQIHALPKGHFLEFSVDGAAFDIRPFFEQTLQHFETKSKGCDLVAMTRELASKSIQSRLIGDCKKGALLSGGLDSSIVCALAREHLSQSFNISFVDEVSVHGGMANEGEFAKQVAKYLGLEHIEIPMNGASYQAELESFLAHLDQPFGSVSSIGVSIIAKRAKEFGIKVLLSGDGADEFFGGYAWYPKLALNNPQAITPQKPKGWHYYAFESEKQAMTNRDFFSKAQSSLRYFPYLAQDCIKPIDCIHFDRDFYLPNEMMVKLDRMCQSQGIEGRACFVSPALVSFARSLCYEHLLNGGTKILLKLAFESFLPHSIIHRPKHGFNPPIDYWMKHQWQDLLQSSLSALVSYGILTSTKAANQIIQSRDLCGGGGNIAFYLLVLCSYLERFKG